MSYVDGNELAREMPFPRVRTHPTVLTTQRLNCWLREPTETGGGFARILELRELA